MGIFLCMKNWSNQFWVLKHLFRGFLKIFKIFFLIPYLSFLFPLPAVFPFFPAGPKFSFFFLSPGRPAQLAWPICFSAARPAKRYGGRIVAVDLDPTMEARRLSTSSASSLSRRRGASTSMRATSIGDLPSFITSARSRGIPLGFRSSRFFPRAAAGGGALLCPVPPPSVSFPSNSSPPSSNPSNRACHRLPLPHARVSPLTVVGPEVKGIASPSTPAVVAFGSDDERLHSTPQELARVVNLPKVIAVSPSFPVRV